MKTISIMSIGFIPIAIIKVITHTSQEYPSVANQEYSDERKKRKKEEKKDIKRLISEGKLIVKYN